MAEPAPVQAPPEDGVAPSPELATAIRAEQALGPIPGLEALEKAHPALAAVARTAMGYKAMLSSAKAFPERTVTPQKGAEEPTPEVLEEHAKEVRRRAAVSLFTDGSEPTGCCACCGRDSSLVSDEEDAPASIHSKGDPRSSIIWMENWRE